MLCYIRVSAILNRLFWRECPGFGEAVEIGGWNPFPALG